MSSVVKLFGLMALLWLVSSKRIKTLSDLANEIDGTIIVPGDPAFAGLVGTAQATPRAFILAQSVRDLQNTMKYARQSQKKGGIKLRIRGSGHGGNFYTICDDCVVILMKNFNQTEFDPKRNVWIVGAGATGEQMSALNAFPVGNAASIFAGGFIQGGGHSVISPRFGLLCDHVVGAWILVRNRLIHATKTNRYSDLLWAVLGSGGGQWGIVVSFELSQSFDLANDYYFHAGGLDFVAEKQSVRSQLVQVLQLFDKSYFSATNDLKKEFGARVTMFPNLGALGSSYIFGLRYVFMQERDDDSSLTRLAMIRDILNNPPVETRYDSFLEYQVGVEYPLSAQAGEFVGSFTRTRVAFDKLSQNERFLDAMSLWMEGLFDQTDVIALMSSYTADLPAFFDSETSVPYRHLGKEPSYIIQVFVLPLSPLPGAVAKANALIRLFDERVAPTISELEWVNGRIPVIPYDNTPFETRLFGGKKTDLFRDLQQIKTKYDPQNLFQFPKSIAPKPRRARGRRPRGRRGESKSKSDEYGSKYGSDSKSRTSSDE